LKQAASSQGQNSENSVAAAAIYLLDIVTSHVPAGLLRSQFSSISSLLLPYVSNAESNAPLLRAAIGCLESLLLAQDSQAWALPQSQVGPRQAIPALLSLAIDSRPKVRKRAQEALTQVLKSPPPGPAIDHPAAEMCAVAAQNNLKHAVDTIQQARKQRGRPADSHEPAVIHALQLTKTIAVASGGWPSKKIETLCELLLSLSRSRNDYLVTSAFEVFEVIFEGMEDEVTSVKLPKLLDAIVELKPAQNDSQLLPPWIAIVSRGYGTSATTEPEDTFAKLPELFDLIAVYLTSTSQNIRVSASQCLISFFANCIPDSVIGEPSVYDEKILEQIASRSLGLLSVKYQAAWKEVFNTLAALFDALRWRGDPFLLAIVKAVGELRSNSGFQGKEEADEVLGRAIRNLGPAAVLSVLPHNLTNAQKGQPGRAWLLPLLRDHVSNTNLAHFKSDLVPLSEAMFQRVLNHGNAEKTMDMKIYETVVQQVWSAFPGYCDLPLDLSSAFDQPFAELISNLLYQQVDLRVDLCRGLQNLVESYDALIASDLPDEVLLIERRLSRAEAEAGRAHLAGLASNMLAVLFNVYSQTLPQSRAYILQCITAYLSITSEADLIATFERVAKMLEAELPAPDARASAKQQQQSRSKTNMPPTSHTLLDLVIALSSHLPRSTFSALFALASSILTNPSILKTDPQLIKKAYKLIPQLGLSEAGTEALKARNGELRQLVLNTSDTTPLPARRDRFLAINTLIEHLPSTDLHFLTTIMSEIVIACKDSNERARMAGFDLLLTAAAKIISAGKQGAMIRNSLAPNMPDDTPDVQASVEEVFSMVSAGLAGVAPHMIAATITALSRLLWEYHGELDATTRDSVMDTVLMFLESNNREIVRAVLGFVKVVVVVIPKSTLEANSRIQNILKGCMIWSKENKGRLRQKVRGILERVLRRWDGQLVEQWVDDDESRKMVKNVRKRKERAKRKKTGDFVDANDNDDATAGKGERKYDNEFDEAVYGSDDSAEDDDDSIMGDSDHEMNRHSSQKSSKRNNPSKKNQQYIRADEDSDDEPLDLLDPKSLGSITSRKLGRLRAEAGLANGSSSQGRRTKARTNEDGKLIFGPNDDEDTLMNTADGNDENSAPNSGGVDAYVAAIDGPDAVRRGQKGKLKVKSAQRQRGTEMELDEDDAKAVANQLSKKKQRPGSSGSMSSSGGAGRGGDKGPKHARRGLGIEKQRYSGGGGGGGGGRGGGKHGGKGFGGSQRRVSFGHGRGRGGFGRR
jgi:ribosomal RNA-processing protein 12